MCPFSQDSGEKLGIYAFCSIACLLMALSCSLIIPLPGQGKVPAGPTAPICWALQLSDVPWRLLQQGPAMLLTSSTVFLAKRWSSGKKAVRASCPGRYKPWPQTFLFLWRQYDSCLHHAYREHHKWAQSRLEIGDSLLERGERLCRTSTSPGCFIEARLSGGKGKRANSLGLHPAVEEMAPLCCTVMTVLGNSHTSYTLN